MTATISASKAASIASLFPGATTGLVEKPLNSLFMLIAGFPGTGKTTFLESYPDLLRINFDRAPTSHPSPRAVVLPRYDDPAFTLETFYEVVDRLVQLARENNPKRPAIVAIDTLDSMVEATVTSVLEYEREKVRASNRARTGPNALQEALPESFHDLDGRRAWGMVYDTVLELLNRLRGAGYGVILTTQVTETKTPVMGSEKVEVKNELTIGDGLWKRLSPKFDMIAALIKKPGEAQIIRNEKGIPVGTKTDMMRFLVTEAPPSERYAAFLKKRGNAAINVQLSLENGFQDFEAAYNATLSKENS